MSHHSWIFRHSTIKTSNARTDAPLNLITRTRAFLFWIPAIFNVEIAPPTRHKILYPFGRVSSKEERSMQQTRESAMAQTDRLSLSLSTLPSTVFHVRALVKTKPQRRSGSSASHFCTIVIVYWEPLEKPSALICEVLWTWGGVFQ